MEGRSLPSFPTTTYWYDAHSTVGSSLYSGTNTLATPYKPQPHAESKLTGSEREPLEWWTDSMCVTNEQRTLDGQYWGGHSNRRGYAPPYDQSMSENDVEVPGQPVVLVNCETTEPEYMNSREMLRMDQDDRSMCCDSTSSQAYSPSSNTSDTTSSKKTSPEPFTMPDDHKRNQKRLRKDVKDKNKEDKRCGVCGDAARSMHFGGMACDSCKAFFRRSVQSGAYKSFQCPENENCPISKQNRKGCQFCRFKKSQENGMEISWVMSETDRMVLWKNRLAKQRVVQEEKIKDKRYGDLPRTLDPREADTLRALASLQEETFNSIPYPEDCFGDSVEALANLFVCICKKLGMFFYKVEDFQEVCKTDQSLLLKNGIGMSIYLHGAYMYDPEREMWPAESNKDALKIPPITLVTLQEFTVLEDAFDAIMKFYNKYAKELKDEIILSLICVVAFFQPDDPQFQNSRKIQDIQLKYLELLRRYLLAKEGDTGVKVTFPKLLVGLADVKEILEFHSKVDIKPTINHQKISTQSSGQYQMSAIKELFQKVTEGQFPEFSSILSASEQRQPLWQRSTAVVRRKRPSSSSIGRGDQFYHPFTNQIFGTNPRTDLIITNPLDQLEKVMKKNKMSVAKISEVKDNWSGCKDLSKSVMYREAERSTSNTSTVYQPNRHLQLPSGSCSQDFSQFDKKRAVEVLCDVLQHITCDDTNHVLHSLQENLAPHLLSNLAHKLSL